MKPCEFFLDSLLPHTQPLHHIHTHAIFVFKAFLLPSIPPNHGAMELGLFIIFHRDDKTPGLKLVLSVSQLMKIDRMVLSGRTEAAGIILCNQAVCSSLTLSLYLSLYYACTMHYFHFNPGECTDPDSNLLTFPTQNLLIHKCEK